MSSNLDLEDLVKDLKNRERYVSLLVRQVERGMLPFNELIKNVAEYDALAATKRTQNYTVIAAIAGAISAVGAAFSAYFSWLLTTKAAADV